MSSRKMRSQEQLREEGLKALLEGGSYRDTVSTEVTMDALNDAPDIPLSVPIRFQERYKKEEDGADTDS